MEIARPTNPLTVITVNGKHFVSGLTWKTLENYRTYMNEAREFGKANNMDMVAIRRGQVLQAGFAPKTEQRLRGMYSLAAALAGKLGENWIGVFPLPNDRFAFIAVYEGSVMVGRDLVGDRYTVEMEFNDAFNLLQSEPAWSEKGRVIAPEDWDFAHEHSTLEDLLNPKALRNDYRLRPLTFGMTRREMAFAGVAVLILAGAGVGFLKWQAYQEQNKAVQKTAAMLELQRAQEAQMAEQAAALRANMVRPWKLLPAVNAQVEACAQMWNDTPLSLGGWIFVGGSCGPGKAMAAYKRPENGTTVAQFAGAVRSTFGQQPSIYEAGTAGSVSANFVLTPDETDELRPIADLLEAFTSHLQATTETSFTLEEKPWQAPEDQPDAIAPDWITQVFKINTTTSPADLFTGLNTQAVRVMELRVTLNESTELQWEITGEIYGR